ncbi:hypothetical protein [Fictibacillus enclensis]|uniref:hypothetical protein n=1 Tax=Fictibacillus enclensis TaxID=1017270 RepID=UPI0024BF2B83|nr:hypothetical protein [Fictibacillus enclensis]WHY72668.1 hypothetical protein QNH15_01635 [Fictibacillus enclensis]
MNSLILLLFTIKSDITLKCFFKQLAILWLDTGQIKYLENQAFAFEVPKDFSISYPYSKRDLAEKKGEFIQTLKNIVLLLYCSYKAGIPHQTLTFQASVSPEQIFGTV